MPRPAVAPRSLASSVIGRDCAVGVRTLPVSCRRPSYAVDELDAGHRHRPDERACVGNGIEARWRNCRPWGPRCGLLPATAATAASGSTFAMFDSMSRRSCVVSQSPPRLKVAHRARRVRASVVHAPCRSSMAADAPQRNTMNAESHTTIGYGAQSRMTAPRRIRPKTGFLVRDELGNALIEV